MNELEQYIQLLSTWNEQWNKICDELIEFGEHTPEFEQIIENSDSHFSHVIKQAIFDNANKLAIPLSDIRYFWRLVNESDINKINEDRFIPKSEYASLNRMNDKDRLFYYFSIGYLDSAGDDVIKTGIHEIRAQKDDCLWKCKFTIPDEFREMKVIDFSTKGRIPKDEKDLSTFLMRKCVNHYKVDKTKLEYWILQFLLQIFHDSNMFQPIDKNKYNDNEQRYFYKPFHVLCDYFMKNGYAGIIYRSTVFPKGRCLALFNIDYAKFEFNTCKKINLDNYIK